MYLTNELGVAPQDLIGLGFEASVIREVLRAADGDEFFNVLDSLEPGLRNNLVRHIALHVPEDVSTPVLDQYGAEETEVRSLRDRLIELTPEQRRVVDAEVTKPLLVQGVPGSGKTTIGVNRLKKVAQRDQSLEGEYLLLTFTRTLSHMCEQLLEAASGGEPLRNAQVSTYHAWLRELLELNYKQLTLIGDIDESVLAWAKERAKEEIRKLERDAAGSQNRRRYSKARNSGALVDSKPIGFWSKEFEEVINGECHGELEAYLEHPRAHRRLTLDVPARIYVHQVYNAYYYSLLKQNKVDFHHLVQLCRMFCLREDARLPEYNEIIVDEAQDLTLTQIDFIAQLARRTGANLVLLADENQSIYRGDFSWRAVQRIVGDHDQLVLTTNHRTPALVGAQARRLISGAETEVVYSKEGGHQLSLVKCSSGRSVSKALIEKINELDERGVPRNHVCVLAASNKKNLLRFACENLEEAGIQVEYYADKWGNKRVNLSENSVKLMTIASSKGLEFDHVFLLRVEQFAFPGNFHSFIGATRDHWEQARRQLLNVGMTRAMKSVTLICNGDYISNFVDDFDSELIAIEQYT